jgi:hypothetical protein
MMPTPDLVIGAPQFGQHRLEPQRRSHPRQRFVGVVDVLDGLLVPLVVTHDRLQDTTQYLIPISI